MHTGGKRGHEGPQYARGSVPMTPHPTPMQPLIAVEDVHTYYGKSHILHGVSFHV
jgi:hypothetical protein